MQDGCEFPPVVLWRPGRGRWIPVDGNQRLAALDKIGRKTTDAYIVETSDAMVADRLTWSFNNLVNGKRLSQSEALAHAVTFVRKYDMSAKQAAKEWGLPGWMVSRALKVAEVGEVLDRNKVKRTPALTDDKLNRLAPLLSVGEDVLSKAAAAVGETGVGVDAVDGLVKEVRESRNHADKLQAVEKFAKSEAAQQARAETKGGRIQPRTPLPRDRFARQVDELLRLVEGYDKAALRPPAGAAYKESREKVKDLVNRLIALYGLGPLVLEEAIA